MSRRESAWSRPSTPSPPSPSRRPLPDPGCSLFSATRGEPREPRPAPRSASPCPVPVVPVPSCPIPFSTPLAAPRLGSVGSPLTAPPFPALHRHPSPFPVPPPPAPRPPLPPPCFAPPAPSLPAFFMWYAVQSKMAADSGMETCPSPDNPENKKRPWDGNDENGTTKRSHYGAGNETKIRLVLTPRKQERGNIS